MSYLIMPTTDDISVKSSFITPPMEPVRMLYTSRSGDEMSIVVLTSLGSVNENDTVLSAIAAITNSDIQFWYVNMPTTIIAAAQNTVHQLLDAHFLSLL